LGLGQGFAVARIRQLHLELAVKRLIVGDEQCHCPCFVIRPALVLLVGHDLTCQSKTRGGRVILAGCMVFETTRLCPSAALFRWCVAIFVNEDPARYANSNAINPTVKRDSAKSCSRGMASAPSPRRGTPFPTRLRRTHCQSPRRGIATVQ